MLQSNEWTGRHSFGGKSLHHLSPTPNPYEQAISIIGKTLSAFDDDNWIPAYGFGDGEGFRPIHHHASCLAFTKQLGTCALHGAWDTCMAHVPR